MPIALLGDPGEPLDDVSALPVELGVAPTPTLSASAPRTGCRNREPACGYY